MSINQPFFSVVVPTYGREKILCDTLTYLLKQSYEFFEIIIVDQTEQHEIFTLNFINENISKFRYFKIYPPNLPNARNYGVKMAKGDIILFVDDDVYLKEDWIENHSLNYQYHDISGVSGRIIEKGITSHDKKVVGKINFWGKPINNRDSTHKTFVEWASGGNTSFRKDLIYECGGFDENYLGNSIFEDVDFSYRLTKLGKKIIFEPKAKLVHLADNSGGCKTREKNKTDYYYWFLRNKTLFTLKNLSFLFYPGVLISCIYRAFKVGLIDRRNIKEFLYLIKSLLDGYKIFKSFKGKRYL